jgi:hypothetical protein
MPFPVLGLLALGAAYLTARGVPADDSTERADPEPDKDPEPVTNTDWTTYLEMDRGDVPLDFLLRWIAEESGGNRCSVGSEAQLKRDGYAREAGIVQLYFESRTQRVFGVTSDDLRGGCSLQTETRPPTEEECRAQAGSLCRMAASFWSTAKRQLESAGLEWSQDDQLALAKLHHGLPALGNSCLPAAAAVGQASAWIDFRAFTLGLSQTEIEGIDRGAAPYRGEFSRIFRNAEKAAGLDA